VRERPLRPLSDLIMVAVPAHGTLAPRARDAPPVRCV